MLQECLDETLLHLCEYAGQSHRFMKLALAGGVALNCTANGRLLKSGLFDHVYVQPAAGDDGSALCAALWRTSRKAWRLRNVACRSRTWVPRQRQRTSTGARRVSKPRPGIRFNDLRATCGRSGQTDSRWAGDRLVPRQDGVWPQARLAIAASWPTREILGCETASMPW